MGKKLNGKKARVGVLVSSSIVNTWVFNVIESLFFNYPVCIIIKKCNLQNNKVPSKRGKNWIIRLHERLDAALYRGRFSYDEKKDLTELIMDETSGSFLDWDEIKFNGGETAVKPTFDIIIDFLDTPSGEEILSASSYGALTFVPTNSNVEGEDYSAYNEILTRNPEIAARVIIRKEQDSAPIIYNSSISLFSNSININRDRIYSLSALLIPRIIDGILKNGPAYIETLKCNFDNTYNLKAEMRIPPSSATSLFNLMKVIFASVFKRFFYKEIGEWHLLYNENNDQKPYPVKFKNYLELKAPNGSFWADPCVINHKSNTYIFVEEFVYSTGVGHISLLIRNRNGGFNSPIPVLKKPYHLSYPFVFSFGGEFYMVPETRAVGSIQLYRGDPFPECWSYVKDLMTNIEATDTTLFHHDNKWWLFTSKVELQNKELVHTELFLYYADDLLTEKWTSHPCNPIVNDISKSRSAGRIFEHEGTLIRPSQDCTGGYGKAINFNEITILNIHDYQERLLTRIKPDWDKQLSGMHTFSQDGNFCVIDVCTPRVRFFK